jgi:hypothetical protein
MRLRGSWPCYARPFLAPGTPLSPRLGNVVTPKYHLGPSNRAADLGNAETVLHNPRHLGGVARQLLKRGMIPTEDGWGGWLGRYQAALCKTTREIEERKERDVVRGRQRGRSRDRSRGR